MTDGLNDETLELITRLDSLIYWRFHNQEDCGGGTDCEFNASPLRLRSWFEVVDAQKRFRVDSACSFLRLSVSNLLYYRAPMARHAALVYTEQFQPSEMRRLVGPCATIMCAYLETWRLEYPGLLKFLKAAFHPKHVNQAAVAVRIQREEEAPRPIKSISHFTCPIKSISRLLGLEFIEHLCMRVTKTHLDIVLMNSDGFELSSGDSSVTTRDISLSGTKTSPNGVSTGCKDA